MRQALSGAVLLAVTALMCRVATANAAPPADPACDALAGLHLPAVTIVSANAVAEGSVIAGERTPALCRVQARARPTPASDIRFELWLPRGWNGRYVQLGNGGFAGTIDLPSLAVEARNGNAAAITDTGHQGTDGFDARWAANAPQRVVDYGGRSLKVTSDAAQSLVSAYYGRRAERRYYVGCSNGGRQALIAAQRYPADWDGIIAGAPAAMWSRQLTGFQTIQKRLRAAPANWIAPAKLPAIQRAALASCPPGVVTDGVASDPRLCRFDAARMACRGAENGACLTKTELASLRLIVREGFEPTSAIPDNWDRWIVNPDPTTPSQSAFADQAFRYLPFATRAGRRSLSALLDADSTDYSRFRAQSGKLITYFGWADAVISPRRFLAYQRRIPARASFYRLFMIPGMTHCQGGPGPSDFGQSLTAPALRDDPRHNIRRALEAWVERGIAPDEIVAARSGTNATRVIRPER